MANQTRKTLIKRLSTLSSNGTGVIPRSSTPQFDSLANHGESLEALDCGSGKSILAAVMVVPRFFSPIDASITRYQLVARCGNYLDVS